MRDIRRALVQLQLLSWAGNLFVTALGEFYQWPWIQRIRGSGYTPTLYYCILKQNFYKIPHHVLPYFIEMSYRLVPYVEHALATSTFICPVMFQILL